MPIDEAVNLLEIRTTKVKSTQPEISIWAQQQTFAPGAPNKLIQPWRKLIWRLFLLEVSLRGRAMEIFSNHFPKLHNQSLDPNYNSKQ